MHFLAQRSLCTNAQQIYVYIYELDKVHRVSNAKAIIVYLNEPVYAHLWLLVHRANIYRHREPIDNASILDALWGSSFWMFKQGAAVRIGTKECIMFYATLVYARITGFHV